MRRRRQIAPIETTETCATEIAEVIAHAVDTFGTWNKASLWLHGPNMVLDGQRPIDLIASKDGIKSVETIIGRIEWGVYS